MIEAMPEEALRLPAVRLAPQPLRATVMQLLANQVSPAERDGDQREELIDSLNLVQVGRFDIEAGDLDRGEERLDSPPQSVPGEGMLGVGVGHDDEVIISESHPCYG